MRLKAILPLKNLGDRNHSISVRRYDYQQQPAQDADLPERDIGRMLLL
jgi:hypothetical protein